MAAGARAGADAFGVYDLSAGSSRLVEISDEVGILGYGWWFLDEGRMEAVVVF